MGGQPCHRTHMSYLKIWTSGFLSLGIWLGAAAKSTVSMPYKLPTAWKDITFVGQSEGSSVWQDLSSLCPWNHESDQDDFKAWRTSFARRQLMTVDDTHPYAKADTVPMQPIRLRVNNGMAPLVMLGTLIASMANMLLWPESSDCFDRGTCFDSLLRGAHAWLSCYWYLSEHSSVMWPQRRL